MRITGQERTALGVVAALLVAGGGYRAYSAVAAAGAEPVIEAAGPGIQPLLGKSRADADDRTERARPMVPGERLDPNTATAAALDRLPGVGPATAEAIVARREAKGPFVTLADLDSVPRIGGAILAEIAPHLTLPPAPANPPPPLLGSRSPASPTVGPVDVNSASAAELDALPGIGPALAAEIVAERARGGGFRSEDDLQRVSGIGAAKVEGLRGHVRFGP